MKIDHIFIGTGTNGKIADDLVSFGLSEGSSRVHKGQGTTNRKFYFENFFLEILWIHNESEIKRPELRSTYLESRVRRKGVGHVPFGMCLVNETKTDTLFENSFAYQPDYFPEDTVIDIIHNHEFLELPWTFRLSVKGLKNHPNEPKNHPNGIKKLTNACFYNTIENVPFKNYFQDVDQISFKEGNPLRLELTFDNNKQDKTISFPKLLLTINY